jgi:hypothetical protein
MSVTLHGVDSGLITGSIKTKDSSSRNLQLDEAL